jgi:hypothetical protein
MKKQPKKVKTIPSVPFNTNEVYLLSQYEASEELQNRLRVWKASREYQFIKSLENIIIRDYSNHNKKLSKQEREFKNQYINWLAVGLESEKFKSLDNIRLRNNNLIQQQQPQQEDNEDYHKDMLTHRGIL